MKDRRVERTRTLLRQALASLVHEKPYHDISVREILDRANVGRSTFYAHFTDKDDLLASGMQGMLESIRSAAPSAVKGHDRVLWFSLPLFEHIERMRRSGMAMPADGRSVLHARLREALIDLIAADVRAEFRGRTRTTVPPLLLARHVASTFILVLDESVGGRKRVPPQEADAMFRALVLPTLASG